MACAPATAPMNRPSLILNHTVWIIPELHSSLPSWILPETRERIWVSSLRYRIAVDPVMAYFWIIVVAQLPQSSYLPLQTPYCLIGLGRTNNYIEEMFAGVSRNQVSFIDLADGSVLRLKYRFRNKTTCSTKASFQTHSLFSSLINHLTWRIAHRRF